MQRDIHYHSWETDPDNETCVDIMAIEKYKLFTYVELANCRYTSVILGICHHYIHSCLLSVAVSTFSLTLTMEPGK